MQFQVVFVPENSPVDSKHVFGRIVRVTGGHCAGRVMKNMIILVLNSSSYANYLKVEAVLPDGCTMTPAGDD